MEKQNKLLKVIILILIFILILGIGIGTGYFINSQNNSKTEEKNVVVENTSKEQNETDNKQNNANETENIKTVIETREMTATEKYAIYSKNIQNRIKSLGKDLPKELEGNIFFNLKNVHSIEEFPVVGAHINEKLEAFVNIKETGDHIKILDNALDCGICSSGNGGTLYVIWAIDINGNLYTQVYDTNDTANRMKFNLSKEKGFSNIISVIQCSGVSAQYPLAIDIEGNTYELYK